VSGRLARGIGMIRLTEHAAEAIEARIIQFDWVERTLRQPDWTDIDPRHTDRIRAFKAIPVDFCVLFSDQMAQIAL
jgi:hypothetical protein